MIFEHRSAENRRHAAARAASGIASLNDIAFCRHALRIGNIVALLRGGFFLMPLMRSEGRTTQKPDTGADRRPHAGIAARGAEQRTACSAYRGGCHRRSDGAVQPGGRRGITLVLGKAAAGIVIVLELVERLTRARHDGNGGPGDRRGLTATEREQTGHGNKTMRMLRHIDPVDMILRAAIIHDPAI